MKVLATTPALSANLSTLSVSDLDVIQAQLRSELISTSFTVHHQGAAYQAAYNKMEEVNRLRLEKLNLSDEANVAALVVDEAGAAVAGSSSYGGK